MLTPALLTPETSAVLILDYQQHVMDGIKPSVPSELADEPETAGRP